MKRKIQRILLCSVLAACSSGGLEEGTPPEPTGAEHASLALSDGIPFWTDAKVPVCFTNSPTGAAAQTVKNALLGSWGAVINFTFKTSACCTSATNCAAPFRPGIDDYLAVELRPTNTWLLSGAFGYGPAKPNQGMFEYCDPNLDRDGDGVRAGVDCNDNDSSIKTQPPCATPNRYQGCALGDVALGNTAIHEIGHALGIPHEQKNPTMPDSVYQWCNWLGLNANLTQPVAASSAYNSGKFGVTYNLIGGGTSMDPGFAITAWNPLSAVTYCPDTDGILDYNGDNQSKVGTDDELADNSGPITISPSDIAAMQLIYGIKGAAANDGGRLYVSNGFEVGDPPEWVATDGAMITPQWRRAGVLDSMFDDPKWIYGAAPAGTGMEEPVRNRSSTTVRLRYYDFQTHLRFASQNVGYSPTLFAGLVTALML